MRPRRTLVSESSAHALARQCLVRSRALILDALSLERANRKAAVEK